MKHYPYKGFMLVVRAAIDMPVSVHKGDNKVPEARFRSLDDAMRWIDWSFEKGFVQQVSDNA